MTELAEGQDRTRFEVAHPPLTLEMFDEDGNEVAINPARLPRLLGWTVLLMPWSPPKRTKGGIILADTTIDANDYLTNVFRVIALGPLAFTHPRLRGGAKKGTRRSSSGSPNQWSYVASTGYVGGDSTTEWHEHEETEFAPGVTPPKAGDWVILRKYTGIMLELEGVRLRIANDDDILAVIDSPNGWKAYV